MWLTPCLRVTASPGGHVQVQDVGGIVERLLGFLEMGRDHVTAETLIQASEGIFYTASHIHALSHRPVRQSPQERDLTYTM